MGQISRGKKTLAGRILACVLLLGMMVIGCLAGCTQNTAPEKLRDLEFTVVGDGEVPEELKGIIVEKQGAPFKLTYSSGQGLYIVQGYGEQETGGYSIAVRQLYLTEDSIVFDAELIGPEKGEDGGTEKSYPYIVIKTEFLENPVVFQ